MVDNKESLGYIPTEKEIRDLFEADAVYKSHQSISTNEYKEAPRLDVVLNILEDLSMPCETCESIECVCKVEVPKTDGLVRCPHCGESYYMEKHSERTAVYYPPIYKDGVNINPDRNTTTTHCTCMNCGRNFSYKNR